eukprot:s963_g46.t1
MKNWDTGAQMGWWQHVGDTYMEEGLSSDWWPWQLPASEMETGPPFHGHWTCARLSSGWVDCIGVSGAVLCDNLTRLSVATPLVLRRCFSRFGIQLHSGPPPSEAHVVSLRWKQRTSIKASGPAIVEVMRHFERVSTPEFPALLGQLKAVRAQHTRQEALRKLVEALQHVFLINYCGASLAEATTQLIHMKPKGMTGNAPLEYAEEEGDMEIVDLRMDKASWLHRWASSIAGPNGELLRFLAAYRAVEGFTTEDMERIKRIFAACEAEPQPKTAQEMRSERSFVHQS